MGLRGAIPCGTSGALRLVVLTADMEFGSRLASWPDSTIRITVETAIQKKRLEMLWCFADVLVLDFNTLFGASESCELLLDVIRGAGLPCLVLADSELWPIACEFARRIPAGILQRSSSPAAIEQRVKHIYEESHHRGSSDPAAGDESEQVTGFCGLVGGSPSSQKLYELIRRIRDLDVNVLINGESGTGKELVAKAIHRDSSRAKQPFVAVSCGAIPDTLFEAEMFGTERGAFTGSIGPRSGYLERAGAGTLFLDEIGELSLNAQVKLLRAIQQREYYRLGSTQARPLSARLLFATHRDLRQMVGNGSFRQDLFFRIEVMRVHTTPLRENLRDLPLLVRHFVEHFSSVHGKSVRGFSSATFSILSSYSWPGNVRELENAIQYAVIMANGTEICPRDLPEFLHPSASMVADEVMYEYHDSFASKLRNFKAQVVAEALKGAAGNKSEAARNLCISRAYLHRLIRSIETEEDAAIN